MKRDIPQLHIKDLKDLRFIVVRDAIDIKDLKDLRHGEGQAPRPTVKCRFFIVARGPVPRDLSAETKNAHSPEATDVCC